MKEKKVNKQQLVNMVQTIIKESLQEDAFKELMSTHELRMHVRNKANELKKNYGHDAAIEYELAALDIIKSGKPTVEKELSDLLEKVKEKHKKRHGSSLWEGKMADLLIAREEQLEHVHDVAEQLWIRYGSKAAEEYKKAALDIVNQSSPDAWEKLPDVLNKVIKHQENKGVNEVKKLSVEQLREMIRESIMDVLNEETTFGWDPQDDSDDWKKDKLQTIMLKDVQDYLFDLAKERGEPTKEALNDALTKYRELEEILVDAMKDWSL